MSTDIAELYRRFAPALFRRCERIVGSADDARDLVQETFARYLATPARDPHAPFAILYRIATNAAIDHLRRRKVVAANQLAAEEQPSDLGGGSRRIDNLRDLAFLTRGLSEEDVLVAVLYHLDGYTHEGIAAALDLSRRTVGKILARFDEHVKKRAARTGYVVAEPGKVRHG